MKHTCTLPKKAAFLLFSVALLLAGGATRVRGQSALDGFDPNENLWSVVSPAPAVSGTNHVVTNALSGPARFYRLRQP